MYKKNLFQLVVVGLCIANAWQAQGASAPPVEAKNGMVVSSQYLASQAGVDILERGGNAIDAAAAVGYALAVTYPCCGNIGGGGFMTVHMADGRNTFFNFREIAPAAASARMYLDAAGNVRENASLYGYLAAGVPGTVLGLDTAQSKYGRLTRAQVMEPAITLAKKGFILTRDDTDVLDTKTDWFKKDPEAARLFLRPDGSTLQPGDRLIQKDLAKTLQAISDRGPDAFYKGPIAQAVARAAQANGGILTAADFANYTVTETAPLTCTYRGYSVMSAPPPSSGGTTLCQILNILEGYDLKASGFHSATSVHYIVEAMRHAYMDRNTLLGDPKFVNNPIERLTSKHYAELIRTKISADSALPSSQLQPGSEPHEKPETTHYSIIDREGNAVSTTYTVNGLFGAIVVAPGTGFFLNNNMDDFAVKPGAQNLFGLVQGMANAIAPGKRPLSSMSPTIVTYHDKTFLVMGATGGPRIISVAVQALLNIIDYGITAQEAVDAPRIHHQWLPDEVYVEQRGLSPDTMKLLDNMGHKLQEQTPWGACELIMVGLAQDKQDSAESSGNDSSFSGHVRPGYYYGANDARRAAGKAIGY